MMILEPSSIRLRFIPLERLLLHEEDDPHRVKRLILALRGDGRLRNPPIVAENGDLYVVLDGATRCSALLEMGVRDALVQIVDYTAETVQVHAWHHVIVGLQPNRLLSGFSELAELTLRPLFPPAVSKLLAGREITAGLILQNGQEFGLNCKGDSSLQAISLCQLVRLYRGKAEVHRTVNVELATLKHQYPNLSAVVMFPTFRPAEILQIATNRHKLPMGITRHIICGRALGLNIPLDMLIDAQSLEAKNDWLDRLLHQRIRNNKVRLYQEPVFVFDE